jgi:hypothetical protein
MQGILGIDTSQSQKRKSPTGKNWRSRVEEQRDEEPSKTSNPTSLETRIRVRGPATGQSLGCKASWSGRLMGFAD